MALVRRTTRSYHITYAEAMRIYKDRVENARRSIEEETKEIIKRIHDIPKYTATDIALSELALINELHISVQNSLIYIRDLVEPKSREWD